MADIDGKKQYFDLGRKNGYLIVELDGNQVHFEVKATLSEKLRDALPVLALDDAGNQFKYQHAPHHNDLIMSAFIELVNESYWQRTQSQPVQERNPCLDGIIDKARHQAWLSNDWASDMRNEAAMWGGV
ncbi:hypothetical protein ACOBWA_08590 [Psychrobacter sp. ER1]|uniref:hypothetical protein n=1 Tax=Psychrobacter sp. ER1 TaxID=3406645 RepID=UPI003B431DA9